jgi:adenine phosphoribosyltransferase
MSGKHEPFPGDEAQAMTDPRSHSTHVVADRHGVASPQENPVEFDQPLERFIRDIPDFPKPGIVFKDITPLLAHPQAFQAAIRKMADHYRGQPIDAVAAAEARGFLFAAPLALALGVGFVPIRKPGKLPFDTHAFHYELEYGNDTLEVHIDSFRPGHRVLIVDDLLATGGTVEACLRLVEKTRAEIAGCCFLIELAFLKARAKLAPYEVFSLIRYDD